MEGAVVRPAIILAVLIFAAGAAGAESFTRGDEDPGPATATVAHPLRGPAVIVPPEAAPGDIVRVVVTGAGVQTLDLANEEQRVVARASRIAIKMTAAVELGVFLLGIDSTVVPGGYRVAGRDAEGGLLFERDLVIVHRDFRTEEIALTPALTSLRADPDPVKDEESRVLSGLLFSRDPQAVFHPGALAWPLSEETRRTSLYGDRRLFLYSDGRRARSIHYGLDFAAPVGTPVTSSGRGVVRMARERIVTGWTVVIEHLPGVYSLYYHLDEISVDEGQMVAEGEHIGTVGATGLATGPHLHWEIRVGGVAVSPEATTARPLIADLLSQADAVAREPEFTREVTTPAGTPAAP